MVNTPSPGTSGVSGTPLLRAGPGCDPQFRSARTGGLRYSTHRHETELKFRLGAAAWKGVGYAVYRVMKRFWIPLLLVVVVAVGAYAIVRIREAAGAHAPTVAEGTALTENFNPKHITYEVTGAGGSANLNYLDENGQPHLVENAPLPWSFTIVTTLPSMSANIMAQGDRNVSGLRCRVTVDGEIRDDRASDDLVEPFIYCLVKSV
ncbi:membrane protein MmpS5_1 [Mycolicibacterium smegmatis]|nr:membrane protein MmpS5_1 [Mycolicibacterium smegmatis]